MDFRKAAKYSAAKVYKELKTSRGGISTREALWRRKKFGPNAVHLRQVTFWKILIRQFKSALIYLLIIAGGLSLLLRQMVDAIAVIAVLILNAAFGVLQEYRAQKTLERLRLFLRFTAFVLRDKKITQIDREQLVPGDIVRLTAGDLVPADVRIVEAKDLLVNEEALTGESYPVEKIDKIVSGRVEDIYEAKNIAFMQSRVVSGSGWGVVIATGIQSQIGQIARLTYAQERETLFEKNSKSLSRFLIWTVIFALLIVFALNLVLKQGRVDLVELLLFLVAIAIAILPEPLPAVTVLSLSRSGLILARKGVIVKRLSAIEDAGNIEVVCADKTGTLTENKLRVHEVFAEHPEQALFLAAAAIPQENLLKLSHADPFDRALFDRLGEREKKEISRLKKLWERPFNPVERSNASVVLLSGRPVLIVRGAPEAILKKSFGFNKQSVEEFYKKEGIAGRRVIALAYKELCSNYQKVQKTSGLENRLCFAGLISFEDQIKTSAYKAVEEAKKLGIEIKILTGDSPEVAKYVAEKLNLLQGRVFSGFELQKMSQREFEKTILSNSVFARVSPQQKLKIVELLVKKKSTAFLGEGINDAPSLEAANVAMVVQSGADISKEAGDIILTKKDLTAVVLAVKEGRRVFINISKYLRYTLIANFGNFFSMAVISLIVPFLPMLAVQILLVNLLSDLPHLAVATDNVDFEEVARPVKYDFRNIGISVLALGLINSVFDFILLAIFFAAPLTRLRSLWFFENALTELLVFFSLRTKKFFLTAAPPSRLVTLGHLVVAVLILLIPFMPGANLFHLEAPSLTQWGIILLLVFAYVISSESAKLLFFKHFK